MNAMSRFTIILIKDKGKAIRFNMRKEIIIFLLTILVLAPFIIGFLFWQITSLSINNSALIDIAQDLQVRIDVLEAEKERYKTLDDYLADSSINTLSLTYKQVLENDQNNTVKSLETTQLPTASGIAVSRLPASNENLIEEHFKEHNSLPFNLGLIKVERINFSKSRDANRRNIIFDIYNSEKDNILNGECRFTLYKSGNLENKVIINTARSTSFRINNYNQMSVSLLLQEGQFAIGDVLELAIMSSGNIIYCNRITVMD